MAGENAGSATVKETAEVIEGNCRNKHHRVLSMDMFNPFGERNAAILFIAGGKTAALATIYRDQESLHFERQLEQRGASVT
ncbi:MAG TPA: hypothetical protein VGR01_17715 [Burkholderiales bacterium]|jgi:hypothetical protein|nr:hypothetical protein [Burkholderiales bacterium]